MKYSCAHTACDYCYRMQKPLSRVVPRLPEEFERDIARAGGFFKYRDEVIIENSKHFGEIAKAKDRLTKRTKSRKFKTLKIKNYAINR